MKELALHIMDIAQNSINAQAKLVKLSIFESTGKDELTIIIEDDGVGISSDLLQQVTEPFVSTRTENGIGLGLSLFKAAAETCDGFFTIESEPMIGTKVIAVFLRSHIDRAPLGNMADTIAVMAMFFGDAMLYYEHCYDGKRFIFDTRELKKKLGVGFLDEPKIFKWIQEHVKDGLNKIMEEELWQSPWQN